MMIVKFKILSKDMCITQQCRYLMNRGDCYRALTRLDDAAAVRSDDFSLFESYVSRPCCDGRQFFFCIVLSFRIYFSLVLISVTFQ